MPIILENTPDSGSLADLKVYSPKFFASALTGSGKSIGILCDSLNPAALSYTPTTTVENINCKKERYTNGNTKVNKIPVNTLINDASLHMTCLPVPDKAVMAIMGGGKNPTRKANVEFYTIMKPHSIVMEETDLGQNPASGASSKSKRVTVCYQIFVFAITDWNNKFATLKIQPSLLTSTSALMTAVNTAAPGENYVTFCYECNTVDRYAEIFTGIEKWQYTANRQSIVDYLNNYSIYDAMVKQSETWQTKGLFEDMDHMFKDFGTNKIPQGSVYTPPTGTPGMPKPLTASPTQTTVDIVCRQLEHLETYPIPLDLYRDIYNSLNANFPPSYCRKFCKHNLNLLLNDTLYNLHSRKACLTQLTLPANPKPPVGPNGVMYSPEQARAITCTDPLVLIQAGAGTGKSTTILARVNWMLDNGVNPKDIMIISFTNAAAENIMSKNPYVQSMTIAKMIHTIYNANFPTHELSSPETLSNTLDIYFPNDPVAQQFRKYVTSMEDKRDNDQAAAYTQMNNYIEANLPDVLRLLDSVRQTTLPLEIIICYQMISQLKEPPEIASKFIIIDEVQDNSVFEFIYSLKYVEKHNEAMLIVGDCSQTLYEFRASNPRALNVLEGSGVFTTHKLQINYRSNQEILDFANVLLDAIEANQYAKIQLQANSLKTVTEDSFLKAVKFHYHRVGKIRDMKDELAQLVRACVKPYVDECLLRNEQVAFLAYTREHVRVMMEELQKLYPTLDKNGLIADITAKRSKPITLFSGFIQRNWSTLTFAPTNNLKAIITGAIRAQLGNMILNSDVRVQNLAKWHSQILYDWETECGATVDQWQLQLNNGQITLDQFLDFVKDNMLQYEIRTNAVRQALLSSKKRDRSFNDMVQNASIIMSTIHGAKGLEFDNTVVLFQSSRNMDEASKRTYYVALTRAKKSEYVLAFDSIPSPKVKADYETIIQQLHQRHPAGPAPAVPLVTGVPGKNQPAARVDDLEGGAIPLIPGIMPECVLIDPDDPVSAQKELEANAAYQNNIKAAQAQAMLDTAVAAEQAAKAQQAPAQAVTKDHAPPQQQAVVTFVPPMPAPVAVTAAPAVTTAQPQQQAPQAPATAVNQNMYGSAIKFAAAPPATTVPIINPAKTPTTTAPVVNTATTATPVVRTGTDFNAFLPKGYMDQLNQNRPPEIPKK